MVGTNGAAETIAEYPPVGKLNFGFQPGENMCRDVGIEVLAHLRTLQKTWEPKE